MYKEEGSTIVLPSFIVIIECCRSVEYFIPAEAGAGLPTCAYPLLLFKHPFAYFVCMSTKYKFTDHHSTYFITATVVDWIDVFTRNDYKNILLDSIRHCQQYQGLRIHAWVLMPNHLHMIYSVDEGKDPALVLKNIKSFTALKIIDAIINNPHESRTEWMLDLFEKNGKANKSNFRFQFWQHENHPVLLDSNFMLEQRMNYLHENPVRAGFVTSPEQWLFSSAVDYYTEHEKGLLTLVLLT